MTHSSPMMLRSPEEFGLVAKQILQAYTANPDVVDILSGELPPLGIIDFSNLALFFAGALAELINSLSGDDYDPVAMIDELTDLSTPELAVLIFEQAARVDDMTGDA